MSTKNGSRAQMVSRVNGLKIDFPTASSNVVARYADSQNALIFMPISRRVYNSAKNASKKVAVIESSPEDYEKHDPLYVNQNVNAANPVNIVDDDAPDFAYEAQANIVDDEPEQEPTPVKEPKPKAPAKKATKSASKTPAARQAPKASDDSDSDDADDADNSDIL